MPSELDRAYFALQDILHNIDLADEFLSALRLRHSSETSALFTLSSAVLRLSRRQHPSVYLLR
jgi:hypothetical protein